MKKNKQNLGIEQECRNTKSNYKLLQNGNELPFKLS